MILYPSIHIRDGHVARLTRGGDDLDAAEMLHTDPGTRAKAFEAQGFSWLHVVDLNGAFEGRSINIDATDSILENVKIPIQLSGGMRSMTIIESCFEKGIERVVLSSAAVHDPELVREA